MANIRTGYVDLESGHPLDLIQDTRQFFIFLHGDAADVDQDRWAETSQPWHVLLDETVYADSLESDGIEHP